MVKDICEARPHHVNSLMLLTDPVLENGAAAPTCYLATTPFTSATSCEEPSQGEPHYTSVRFEWNWVFLAAFQTGLDLVSFHSTVTPPVY